MNDRDRRRWFHVGIVGVLVLVLTTGAVAPIMAGASETRNSKAPENLAGAQTAPAPLQANETETTVAINATTTGEIQQRATERKAGETATERKAAETTTGNPTTAATGTPTVTPAFEEGWQIDPTLNESTLRNMTKAELIERVQSLQRVLNVTERQYLERIRRLESQSSRAGVNTTNATETTSATTAATATETTSAETPTEETSTAVTTEAAANATNATEIRLGGRTSGWVGMSPQSINGTVNPTLNLTAGEKYTITWVNLDGEPHNVVIRNSNGEDLLRTDIVAEQGATQSVTFTATEEMATYLCELHPTSMVGDVSVSSNNSTAGNAASRNAVSN